MKVLWFTNILLPAAYDYLGLQRAVGGGWMDALRSNLEKFYPKVDLHIASFSREDFTPFLSGNATYYPVVQSETNGRVKQIIRNWKHTKYSSSELKQCIDLVGLVKPDLIHIHGSENLFGLVQEHTDIPVVISLQGILQSYQYFYFPGLGIVDRLRIERMSDLLQGRGLTHKEVLAKNQAKIEARILSNCSHFLGRTEWDKSIALLMNPRASYYTAGEILREPFYSIDWNNSFLDKKIVFSTISGGIRKGIFVLLDAIGILKTKGYYDISLRLAGSIRTSAIWPLIHKRIAKNDIKQNIHFCGSLNAFELATELSQSSVFVHPSYIDNSPNSLAEAMIIGTPVVATCVGGVPSMLEHNKEGLICMPGDPFSLATAIGKVLSDENTAKVFSKNSRLRAKTSHNKKKVIDQLISSYKSVMSD